MSRGRQKVSLRKKWPGKKRHINPADFFSTNEDKTKLNWFLFEYALELEASVWRDKELRERLRDKDIGDREVAAFCVSHAKLMKREILDRVSGKTENVRIGYKEIEAYFPIIGDALVDRLLMKAVEAWDSQTKACVVCPTRCISEKEQRAPMFDAPYYRE